MFANLLNLKKTYQQQLAWRKSKLPLSHLYLMIVTRALTGCLSALSYDSCRLYDGIKTHFNRAHWIDKSVLFRQNGRLYKIS